MTLPDKVRSRIADAIYDAVHAENVDETITEFLSAIPELAELIEAAVEHERAWETFQANPHSTTKLNGPALMAKREALLQATSAFARAIQIEQAPAVSSEG